MVLMCRGNFDDEMRSYPNKSFGFTWQNFLFHLEICKLCTGITINVKNTVNFHVSTEISPGILKFHLARIVRIPVLSEHEITFVGHCFLTYSIKIFVTIS